MPQDYCKALLRDFLANSWNTVEVLVERLRASREYNNHRHVSLFRYVNGEKIVCPFNGNHFYLRGSVEYSNPQLTVEEIQGIVGVRLLEACANYFDQTGLHQPYQGDVEQILEALKHPPQGYIVPFLLNTDDVEPDRYSMNPLRSSIVESGQSAFPAANVTTPQLKLDPVFLEKYSGKLVSAKEADQISRCLKDSKGSYLDFVDSVKYGQLAEISELCGMNLSLFALRMPLSTLQAEQKDGLLHYIIGESHRDYESIEQAYICMGRSMTKRTTLLTVPHSKKGYGSKRAARGKIHFQDGKLKDVNVKYKPTQLYPNGVDPKDVSMAQADDDFTVQGDKLSDYSYTQTPSSPQFFLYSMGSPEDAAVWHGVGAFASPQLLQSYSAARNACKQGKFLKNLRATYHVRLDVPLQFNLVPASMWRHPVRQNIDASVGCIEDFADLARWGMRLEYLAAFK